jgi:hypothetical protein
MFGEGKLPVKSRFTKDLHLRRERNSGAPKALAFAGDPGSLSRRLSAASHGCRRAGIQVGISDATIRVGIEQAAGSVKARV